PDTILTFNTGDQVKTIPVTINGGSAVTDKTFTVTLSNPSSGAEIANPTGTATITATRTPSSALISELRSSGPAGAGDDFVDIDNDANVGLFSTSGIGAISTANRLDAVGFGGNTGGTCDLLRECNTLAAALGSTSQYSFVRKAMLGTSQDTDDNGSDFWLIST